jgi:hypothetical protein
MKVETNLTAPQASVLVAAIGLLGVLLGKFLDDRNEARRRERERAKR